MFSRTTQNFVKSCARQISHQKRRQILQDVETLKEFDLKSKRHHLRVYVWGLAETGALGIQRSLKNHKKTNCLFVQHPSRLSFGEKYEVRDCAAGYGFSLFVVKPDDNGITLFGTGINTDSQIGYHKHSGKTNRPIEIMICPAPIILPKVSQIEVLVAKKVAAGRAHTLVLTDCGNVFTLGNNAYGQCARHVIENEEYSGSQLIHRLNPDTFKNQRIVDVVCGQDHSFFIAETGTVYSCGWGADGQTGLGHYNNYPSPQCLEGDIKNEKIVKVSGVGDCVLALNDKGDVFGWGNSEYGQLTIQEGVQQINTPTHLKFLKGIGKVIDIAAGGSFCAVLNEDGNMLTWGFGILGMGPNVEHSAVPLEIPPTLFGRNAFNPTNRITSIACGLNHMAAINSDNDLFTWGRNKFGCLGLGHEKDQFFPYKTLVGAKVQRVECGVDHSIALCKTFI